MIYRSCLNEYGLDVINETACFSSDYLVIAPKLVCDAHPVTCRQEAISLRDNLIAVSS